mgnify:CR=1 FL=1
MCIRDSFKRQWMLSRKFGYITPGEMYYDYYKSNTLRIITVLITFFVSIPLLAVFFGATGYLINILSEGYVSREMGMWVVSTIVLFYVTRGGFKSIVSVGVVQSWLYFVTVFSFPFLFFIASKYEDEIKKSRLLFNSNFLLYGFQ